MIGDVKLPAEFADFRAPPADWYGRPRRTRKWRAATVQWRNPKEWKKGRIPSRQSLRLTLIVCCTPSRLETMLRWLSITPLGVPVLPLEKITVASESSFTSRGISQRRSTAVGTRRARAAQTSLSSLVKRLRHIFDHHHAGLLLDSQPAQQFFRRENRLEPGALHGQLPSTASTRCNSDSPARGPPG